MDASQLMACPHWGKCEFMNDNDHKDAWIHPCRYEAACRNNDQVHRKRFWHPPASSNNTTVPPQTQNIAQPHVTQPTAPATSPQTPTGGPKNMCRYGADCRNQNDPVHASRWLHRGSSTVTPTTDVVSNNDQQTAPSQPVPAPHQQNVTTTPVTHKKIDATTTSNLPMCKNGPDCKNLTDTDHCSKFCHPAGSRKQCSQASSCDKTTDTTHVAQFTHPCKFNSKCKNQHIAVHCERYTHPCAEFAFCKRDLSETDHFQKLIHYCPDGFGCNKLMDAAHTERYIHPCRYGAKCKQTNSPSHVHNYRHPCAFYDQCSHTADINHRELFVHPCMYGINCRNQDDPKHVQRFRHPCKDDLNCTKMTISLHTNFFTHSCKNGAECKKLSDVEHVQLFTHPWKMGSKATDIASEIQLNGEMVDLLISMTAAAALGDPTRFNPFPGGVTLNGQFPFMKTKTEKDIFKVQAALYNMPSIREMKKSKTSKDLQMQLDAADPLAFPLLQWILASCQASLQFIPKQKQIPEMQTPFQFVLLSSPLEASKKFGELKRKYGTFYAWHGSTFNNWHCIVRVGLKNYSGTSLMTTGAVYGPGIYLAPGSAVSFGYAKIANGWNKSAIGAQIQCLALCEVINYKGQYKANPYYVIPNEDHVMTRLFFCYPNSSGVAVDAMSIKVPQFN